MKDSARAIVTRNEMVLLALSLLVLAALSFLDTGRTRFVSTEVRFADASPAGLAIVPASCPSSPHWRGQCDDDEGDEDGDGGGGGNGNGSKGPNNCTPTYVCVGNSVRATFSNCGVQTTPCPTGWSCNAGACLPPPPPEYVEFFATLPLGRTSEGGSQTFSASGHLQARPTLVRHGDTTQLYWSLKNVTGCTVSGTNGDEWSQSSSGSTGIASSPLIEQTTFTLYCDALVGATPPSITESVLVRIAPVFQEQ